MREYDYPHGRCFMSAGGQGGKIVVIRWQRFIKMNVIKGFVYEKG